MRYTLLMSDLTIGYLISDKTERELVGQYARVKVTDENGKPDEVVGIVQEVLEQAII